MTPAGARRLARAIHRRVNWIWERCQKLRTAGEDGDDLAARVHESLVEEQLGVPVDVVSVVEDAIERSA